MSIQEETGRRKRNIEKEQRHFQPLGELTTKGVTWRPDFARMIANAGLE